MARVKRAPETAVMRLNEKEHRMKTIRLTLLCLLLGVLSTGSAWADRGRGGHRSHSAHNSHSSHFGIVIGPYWGPSYYPPFPYYRAPYYPYYPPVVIERPVPQVYIEQQPLPEAPPTPSAAPLNYWYYCAETNGYYPYVKECRGGWQKVLPQPPGQP